MDTPESAVYSGGYIGRRSICAHRHRIYDGIRNSKTYQLRSRRHLHGCGNHYGLCKHHACRIFSGQSAHSSFYFDFTCYSFNGFTRIFNRKSRIQAAAQRSENVGNDFGYRCELPASESGVLHHRRS